MQSTESQRRDQQRTEHGRQWAAVGRRVFKRTALLWWVAVGSYAVARPLLVPTYTVLMVGSVVCLTLIAVLLDSDQERSAGRNSWQSWLGRVSVGVSMGRIDVSQVAVGRVSVGGLVLAMLAGTVGIVLSVDHLTASQPQLTTGGLLAGVLLSVGLVGAVARRSGVVAGMATVGIGISWASAPELPVFEVLVFDGIYGPLTQATVVWIAPACLLVGLWQAAGLSAWFDTIWPTRVGTRVDHQTVRQLAVGAGAAAILIGWQTTGNRVVTTLGLSAAISIVGLASLRVVSRPTSQASPDPVDWLGPLALTGGPLGVMAILGLGYRLPFGIVVVAGCLCCLGCCLVGSLVDRVASSRTTTNRVISNQATSNHVTSNRVSTAVRVDTETVFDGGLAGVRLLGRIVVLVAVVSGAVAVIEAAGLLIPLLTAVVWLSGGHWLAVLLVVAGCCVALGTSMPMIAGYTAGALIGVPVIQLLTPMTELSAHLLVVSAVGLGYLLAESQWTTEIISSWAER